MDASSFSAAAPCRSNSINNLDVGRRPPAEPALNDPVADALGRLHRQEASALETFRRAAVEALARFPSLLEERERILEAARAGALAEPREFRGLEEAGKRQALRAAMAAVHAREAARTADGTAAEAFYAKLGALPPNARRLAILAFVKRIEFAEAIRELNLNGAALSAEITSLRRTVNREAAAPPAEDYPAYTRIPFLVSGRLTQDDALRVREYLGGSEACRAAYRDLDAVERALARLGPAAAESHPGAEEWITYADREPMDAARRDAMAEHARLCRACAAFASEAGRSAAAGGAVKGWRKLDAKPQRRRIAAAAVVLSLTVPLAALALTRDRLRRFEFGAGESLDIGAPLSEDPGREPFRWTGSPAWLRIAVGSEAGIAYDLRLESSTQEEVAACGDVPVRDLGAGRGEIVFALRGAALPAGDYRLHVLRRKRGAGGSPGDAVYPLVVP